jgi:hypothetical protein
MPRHSPAWRAPFFYAEAHAAGVAPARQLERGREADNQAFAGLKANAELFAAGTPLLKARGAEAFEPLDGSRPSRWRRLRLR